METLMEGSVELNRQGTYGGGGWEKHPISKQHEYSTESAIG